MEHNSIWSLPEELNEIIFSFVPYVADLLRLRSVSKSILKSLSNQTIWKTVCIQEFDLEFIDENSNWIELASKYGAINYNIRKSRVVVQALAVTSFNSDRLYTGESYVLADNKIVVNWLRTQGSGSSSLDYSDHSAILNIITRKEEQSIKLQDERSLIVIGDKLVETDWNSYNVKPFYTNVTLSDSSRAGTFAQKIPTSENTRTISSNTDPDRKHIVVIVDAIKSNRGTDFEMKVYDLHEHRILKTFEIKRFYAKGYFFSDPVIFHGEFVYLFQDETKVLHRFNVTSEDSKGDQYEIPLGQIEYGSVTCAHKSIVFGYHSDARRQRGIWIYDVHDKKLKVLENLGISSIKNMVVHCGVLVVDCGQFIHFIDYRADPQSKKLVSTLQIEEVYQTSLHPMKDGTLFLSGNNAGANLLDFEHANDKCELLSITMIPNGEKKLTPIEIRAYELVSRAKELLGTHEFVSRYFKMNAKQRFGIIYTKDQKKSGKGFKLPSVVTKKPEYNTPYMYYKMTLVPDEREAERIVWAVPTPIKEFFGSVILFYEEFDGKRWRLSKPAHWNIEELMRSNL